jgi:kynurenine formamidase
MVANTGTYLDTPYHRYADGFDLAQLPLERIADLPALIVRASELAPGPIDWASFSSLPDAEFRFSAVPPKITGMGTFPVRAYGKVTTARRPSVT